MNNKTLAIILDEIAGLLEIKGETFFRINAYKKASKSLESSEREVYELYKEKGLKGIRGIKGIGDSIAKKIEEYIKSSSAKGSGETRQGRIKYYEELKEETAIRQVITYYFQTKGLSLQDLKENARKRKIIYSRFTKPAKQLLELAGSLDKAKEAIKKVADWASSRNLDYAIETVFKKWLELDRLKPKEIVKKPFYRDNPMIWSETKKKWYVIDKYGDWLEYAGKVSEIEWRIIK
ncbi:hypothetical protein KJ786_02600 [Patescibacteria group bacterium]|nr:hypothetical protein [Patescibacteria group bacterium]